MADDPTALSVKPQVSAVGRILTPFTLVLAQVKFACLPDPSVLSLASAFPIPR